MSTILPTFSGNVDVIAAQALSHSSQVRGTIDLSAKFGAYLFPAVGRSASGTLSEAVAFRVYPRAKGGSTWDQIPHPGPETERLGGTGSASESTVSVDAAAAATSITLASAAGFAAEDVIVINDGSGGGFTRLEWNRVRRVATNTLHLSLPLQFAHTAAQADKVRNRAEVYPKIWLDGGAVYECIFDYAPGGVGNDVIVRCKAHTLDSHTLG